MESTEIPQHIVLFDGVCNLCNGWVKFIIKNDPKIKFKFATLQSNSGKALLEQHRLTTDKLFSIVYLRNGKLFTRSSAALYILRDLSGLYSMAYCLIIVPKPFRDAIYDIIANNRYTWFGKMDSCMIPDESVMKRFIND